MVHLRTPVGLLKIGTGSSREADPFVVRLRYRLENRQISYSLDATPWANVSGPGGMSLGRAYSGTSNWQVWAKQRTFYGTE